MADELFIKIKTLIEKLSDAEIAKVRKELENKIKPLNLKVEVDRRHLSQISQTVKAIAGEFEGITEEVRKYNQAVGVSVKEIRKFKAGSTDAYAVIKKTTVDLHKYWDERFKEQIKQMTSKPDVLKQMAEYYKELDQVAKKQAEIREKQSKHWDELFKERIQTMTSTPDGLKQLNQYYKELEITSNKFDNFRKKMLGFDGLKGELDIFSEKYKGKYNETALINLRKHIDNLTIATPNLSQEMKKAETALSLMRKEAAQSSSVLTRMFENMYKFMRFYLVGGLIVGISREFRKGIDFVKELDKELTEVAMLTDMNRFQTRELAKDYVRLGNEMGKTVKEISSVNKELIRQGLSLEVARKRMDAVLKFSSTASISVDESLRIITSSVNAMKESAEKTSDVLLLAGAISASSAKDIGEAFTRTASSAKSTGMSLESLTSIIATLIEVTQESPSSLGTSMKTLLSRFNMVNEETGELNESLNQVQTAFESVGIAFFDAEGQIRPVDQLLADLSTKWNSLDKNTQMYIATQAAGTRQINRFLAIMDNFNRVQEIHNELLNAAGTTNQYYSKWLESTEAAANRAQNAMQQFYINAFNSDTVRDFYNVLALVIGGFDKLINNSFTQFTIQVTAITTGVMLLVKVFNALQKSTLANAIGYYALEIAQKGLIVTSKALAAALWASPLFQVAIITTAILGIVKVINYFNDSLKRQEELVNSLKSEIDSLQSEYNELRSQKDLTEEQKTYLKLLHEEINAKKRSRNETLKNLMLQKYFTPMGVNIYGQEYGSGASDVQRQIDRIEELKKKQTEVAKSSAKWKEYQSEIDDLTIKLTADYKELSGAIEEFGDDAPGYMIELAEAIANTIIPAQKEADKAIQDTNESLSEQIRITTEDFKKAREQFGETTSKLQSLYKIQEELNKEEKLSADSIKEIINMHENLLPYLNDEIKLREELKVAIAEEESVQKQAYENMLVNSQEYFYVRIKGNEELYSKLKEYYGADVENFRTVAQLKAQIDAHLQRIIGEGWANLYGNTLKGQISALEQLTRSMESRYGHREDLLYKNEDYLQSMGMLKSLKILTEEINTNFDSIDFSKLNLSESSKSGKSYISQLDQFYNYLQRIAKLEADINKLTQERDLLTSQLDILSSLQQEKQLQEELAKLYNELNVAQQNAIQQMAKQFAAYGNIVKVSDDLRTLTVNTAQYNKLSGEQKEKLDKLIDEYTELSKAIDSTSSSMREAEIRIKSINEEIQKTIDETFANYQNYVFSQLEEQINALEKEKKAIREVAESRIKALQEEIKSLQEVNDLQKEQEEREKRLIEIEELHERLRNIRNQKNVRIYQKQADGTWDFDYVADPNEVERLQEELKNKLEDFDKWERDLRTKSLIDKKQKEIEAIREELEREEKRYDERIEALKEFIASEQAELERRSQYQITSLQDLANQLLGIDIQMYSDRLVELGRFVDAYNKLAKQLNLPTIDGSALSSGAFGGSSNPLGMSNEDFQKYLNNKKMWESGINREKAAKENQELREKYNIPSDMFSYEQLKRFDKGGYTADSEGLAWLDKQEIVLKDTDTSNLLKTIELNRLIVSKFKMPQIQNLVNTSQSPAIYIDRLEFPSVRDGKEVIETLKQLPRLALQYAK